MIHGYRALTGSLRHCAPLRNYIGTLVQTDLFRITIVPHLGSVTLKKSLNLSERSFYINKRTVDFNRKL